VKSGTSIHLALDCLQPINLTFRLAVAGVGFDRRRDSLDVLLKTISESNQRAKAASLRILNPT